MLRRASARHVCVHASQRFNVASPFRRDTGPPCHIASSYAAYVAASPLRGRVSPRGPIGPVISDRGHVVTIAAALYHRSLHSQTRKQGRAGEFFSCGCYGRNAPENADFPAAVTAVTHFCLTIDPPQDVVLP